MPIRYRSEQLVSRLRAHNLVPRGVAVKIEHLHGPGGQPPAETRADGRIRWHAVNAVTGEPLGVGSAHTMEQVARCPRWALAEQDGMKLVSPDSAERTP